MTSEDISIQKRSDIRNDIRHGTNFGIQSIEFVGIYCLLFFNNIFRNIILFSQFLQNPLLEKLHLVESLIMISIIFESRKKFKKVLFLKENILRLQILFCLPMKLIQCMIYMKLALVMELSLIY